MCTIYQVLNEQSGCHPFTLQYTDGLLGMHFAQTSSNVGNLLVCCFFVDFLQILLVFAYNILHTTFSTKSIRTTSVVCGFKKSLSHSLLCSVYLLHQSELLTVILFYFTILFYFFFAHNQNIFILVLWHCINVHCTSMCVFLRVLQAWADAFRSSPDLTGVVHIYEELKRKGIEFPMADLDALSPIHTPQRVRRKKYTCSTNTRV